MTNDLQSRISKDSISQMEKITFGGAQQFGKEVSISLQSENYLKILSLSGEEIIQFNVTGGGFSWNLTDRRGNKILPGTYLIFILSEYGGEGKLVGKFLVL